jgi:metal-sulfur cluster biosynthetic enzyme
MSNLTDWLGKIQSDEAVDRDAVRERVVAALKKIYDPELPVNIYDLGLIYSVDIDEQGVAEVKMTLTTPGCPVAQTFPGEVESTVRPISAWK